MNRGVKPPVVTHASSFACESFHSWIVLPQSFCALFLPSCFPKGLPAALLLLVSILARVVSPWSYPLRTFPPCSFVPGDFARKLLPSNDHANSQLALRRFLRRRLIFTFPLYFVAFRDFAKSYQCFGGLKLSLQRSTFSRCEQNKFSAMEWTYYISHR